MIYVVSLEDREIISDVDLVAAFKDRKKAETYAQKILKEHLDDNYEPDEYKLPEGELCAEIIEGHHYVEVRVEELNILG